MAAITDSNLLGLDVGSKRIGVALASGIAKLAAPLTTIERRDDQPDAAIDAIITLCRDHNIGTVVVGLPRSMDGNDTPQTAYCRAFAHTLTDHVAATIALQDEALTSVQAERELTERGKPFDKGEVDALAASYILDDYIQEHRL